MLGLFRARRVKKSIVLREYSFRVCDIMHACARITLIQVRHRTGRPQVNTALTSPAWYLQTLTPLARLEHHESARYLVVALRRAGQNYYALAT
jgi:hypothetical protein